jgi:hypothetical protein
MKRMEEVNMRDKRTLRHLCAVETVKDAITHARVFQFQHAARVACRVRRESHRLIGELNIPNE